MEFTIDLTFIVTWLNALNLWVNSLSSNQQWFLLAACWLILGLILGKIAYHTNTKVCQQQRTEIAFAVMLFWPLMLVFFIVGLCLAIAIVLVLGLPFAFASWFFSFGAKKE